MNRLLKVLVVSFYLCGIFLPKLALALSNDPGSDPSGKSQRLVIEKAPWYDPTACAVPVNSANQNSIGNSAKGATYLIGDSITQNASVQGKLRDGLEQNGYKPFAINSLSSRRLTDGPSDLDGISVFEKDVNAWRNAKNIIIELGTNGTINDQNIQKMMNILKQNNTGANVYWVNVGSNNSQRSIPLDTDSINTILKNNSNLGYKIIDWKTVVDQNPQYISDLGVHPFTTDGSKAFADTIINSLASTGSTAGNIAQSDCYCPTGTINNGFSGSNNVEIAFKFFNGRQGIKAYQSAGIVGNLMAESGVNLDTGAINPDGSASFGIAQWLGGRKDRLIEYAASQSKEPTDLQVQLEFIMIELNGSESKSFQELLSTNTVEEAAVSWDIYYERSSGQARQKRIEYAKEVLQLYGGSAIIDNVITNSCQNNPGSIGQAPNGFVFPLLTTKSDIEKGNEQGLRWCFSSQTSCHHDYPAADFGVNPGTVVVASIGGKVVNSDISCSSSCSIQIKGTDQNVYFYAHLAGGSITVKTGDTVNAGQPIGKVGTTADAEGTSPHLHFNIMNSNFDYMPVCHNTNCPYRDQMIDPQPWLIAAYNNLPQ